MTHPFQTMFKMMSVLALIACLMPGFGFWVGCTAENNTEEENSSEENNDEGDVVGDIEEDSDMSVATCTAYTDCTTYLCSNGSCTTCATDSDCVDSTGFCDAAAERCVFGFNVACSTNADCRSGSCINSACATCGGATQEEANQDCAAGVCNITTGQCVDCNAASDCAGDNMACESEACVEDAECSLDIDCAGNANGTICSQAGICIEYRYCVEDEVFCDGGLACVSGVCR